MTTTIFDKTDKGRDEIATRVNHLPARLRTLLLLVDGKRDTAELMVKVAGLGLDEKSLVELLDGDFIQIAGGAPPIQAVPVPQATATAPLPEPVAATAPVPAIEATAKPASVPAAPSARATASPAAPASVAAQAAEEADDAAPARGTTSESDVNAANAGILRDGETQFQALYNFFNETIRSVIGLRGFTMQLKVERAVTIADFRLLRPAYLEAVLKAKGPEMERSLRDRLDQLLGLGD